MKLIKKLSILSMAFIAIFLIGCNMDDLEESSSKEAIYQDIIYSLHLGDFDAIYEDIFSEEIQEELSLSELERNWEETAKNKGELVRIRTLDLSTSEENHEIYEARLEYEEANFDIRMIFNDSQKVVGFNLTNAISNATIPNLVVEESVLIGEGSDYELGATLTLPRYHQEELPAVILVHGSGPVDRDETVLAYKPFRDIAWGLAEQGIAVLRYDKRTFVYGEEMSQELDEITAYEETVEDAIKAAQMIKNDKRINENNVFIIGHSLGGMLAPRIDQEGGEFAGIVTLAASPRSLWEIVYDQNEYFLDIYLDDDSEKAVQIQAIEEEVKKAQRLEDLTEEEAREVEIFGIKTHYLQEMEEYNSKSMLTSLDKPILMLQGEDDFQVSYEKDFAIWKELLEGKDNVSLISYEKLNHFFVQYTGRHKGKIEEYHYPGQVSEEVILDIGNWINENAN